ncbi:MAG: D-tyrosyl-tRNA(Tyr) deacylase [Tannerella sp.]|jgi:D-tyrosyl-tRNA(Tyr) deacylase|nr:D-tyrosyl-tRNA(Tyr) deacylase [Tannerella sp.]
MKTVIQRVQFVRVTVNGVVRGEIKRGLLVLVGIEDRDRQEDIEWLAKKICNLRIFDDENGMMNCSVKEVGGDILVISQFTLYASTKKGNRPSYIRAAKPEFAVSVYESFCDEMGLQLGHPVQTGVFGADMKVQLLNDGPVTIVMDTKNKE